MKKKYAPWLILAIILIARELLPLPLNAGITTAQYETNPSVSNWPVRESVSYYRVRDISDEALAEYPPSARGLTVFYTAETRFSPLHWLPLYKTGATSATIHYRVKEGPTDLGSGNITIKGKQTIVGPTSAASYRRKFQRNIPSALARVMKKPVAAPAVDA